MQAIKGVIKVPLVGLYAAGQRVPMTVLVGDPVKVVMMHDFYWMLRHRRNRANNDVLRLSPSRMGINSRDSIYRGNNVYGYELIGDWIYVWESLYDNHSGYNWNLTDEENVANRANYWDVTS